MKWYVLAQIKRHFITFSLIAVLTTWGLVVSYRLVSEDLDPVLIAIDANGTRVITSEDDPIFKTEVIAFLRHFSLLLYNFDSNSFKANVGMATTFFSDQLWNGLSDEYQRKMAIVQSSDISMASQPIRITKIGSSTFSVDLKVRKSEKLNIEDYELKANIEIKPSERTATNPWGIEVVSLTEHHINQ